MTFLQAWCFTEPTSTVTPLRVSPKRLERAQSSCRKLTLRNLTFPSEARETDYEMGNKRKTRTAMQSKIAALYRWILLLVLYFLMMKNSAALYKNRWWRKQSDLNVYTLPGLGNSFALMLRCSFFVIHNYYCIPSVKSWRCLYWIFNVLCSCLC